MTKNSGAVVAQTTKGDVLVWSEETASSLLEWFYRVMDESLFFRWKGVDQPDFSRFSPRKVPTSRFIYKS